MFILLAKTQLQNQFINAQFCKEKNWRLPKQPFLSNLSFIPAGDQNAPLRNDDIGQES
jgi:hypothetical protein